MKLQTKYHAEAATNNNVPVTFNEATWTNGKCATRLKSSNRNQPEKKRN